MNRWQWAAVGVLIVLSAMMGCSRESAAPAAAPSSGAGKSITIWWAQWAPAVGLQELGREFEKETGITVKVHQIPWSSYQDQVFLNFGNRQTDFDIVVGDSQWIGRGASEKLYVDLTAWLPTAVDLAKVHAKAIRYLCEYPPGSGKFYAAPCETDAIGFAYRRDWFEDPQEKAAFQQKYHRELTVPKTWDEFRDLAEFFNRPAEKRHGCALLTDRAYDALVMGFQQLMWEYGGSWGDEKTYQVKGAVDSEASVAALDFFKSLLKFAPDGAANFDYGKNLEVFVNGSTAMSMNYFAFFPDINAKMGDKAGFFALPSKDGRRAISLGGQGMSISAKIPVARQELAKQFIAWFLQTRTQQQWIRKPAGFTANIEILSSEEFKRAAPYNAPFAESLDSLRDFWNVPAYNELLAAAQRCIGEALDGTKTSKQALDTLAAEHEKIFRDAGLLKN